MQKVWNRNSLEILLSLDGGQGMEELENILKQMRDQPIQILKNPEIYYVVSIKDRYICKLHLTTITKEFCGRIENQTSTSIYFRLNCSDALVIIPHNWIEWMAPAKKLWQIN